MRRKLPWPFIAVIACSFLIGAIWGWKIIRDRATEEGRLEAEAKLRILAPPGIFSKELLVEFQRREKIEVELSVETFPASLLRRALKSAPGQYDAVLLYHHQISALRAERKLAGLFDSRVKFPTSISPDFRKLPNDRNLMDTAPLMWGLLGVATKKEFESGKLRAHFWPSFLIGMEDTALSPASFTTKIQPVLGGFDALESAMKKGPGGLTDAPTGPTIISHGALAFSPMKDLGLKFEPLKASGQEYYPMWILSLAGLADGDLERTRKFVRFLLEPAPNLMLLQTARIGATTLREQDSAESLPANLKASFFRTFPIDKILLERDERVRNADEVLEQMILGGAVKGAKPNEPPKPLPPVAKRKAKPAPPATGSGDEEDVGEEHPTSAPAPQGGAMAPSGSQSHDD